VGVEYEKFPSPPASDASLARNRDMPSLKQTVSKLKELISNNFPFVKWFCAILLLEIGLSEPSWNLAVWIPFAAFGTLVLGFVVWVGSTLACTFFLGEDFDKMPRYDSQISSARAMFLVIIASTGFAYWHKYDHKDYVERMVRCVEKRDWEGGGELRAPDNVAEWCNESIEELDATDSPT